ncbi:putative protein involved in outer membrane biogenesis [Thiorhodovibrio winogradskyi]|uniref:YhdP central domain-containing protein n=1 Tax=Thiorhodovibrio winogradskyi TaxID=77007 RepID=A0ABZ0SC32_9GAMM|nr:YhdP family protein [Thiorhodovibrio winogradskyi]
MKRMALKAFRQTRRLAVIAVLGLAALLLVARALVPFAEGLRGELVTHLGDLLGMQVEVGALTVRFEGWSPRLTLTDVILRGRLNDQAEFSARELRLDLNLFATLRARHPRINGLTLVGADLELRRDTEGRLLISGLQALGGGNDEGGLAFFLREGHFALTDSRLYWADTFSGATSLVVEIWRLNVVNRDQEHLLRLDAWLAADTHTRLSARGRLHGSAKDLNGWAGDLYTRFESQRDLKPLIQSALPRALTLSLSGLRLETWSKFHAGRPVEVLARLRADAFSAARVADAGGDPEPDKRATLALEGLSGLLEWSRQGATTRLRVADLRARELGAHPLSIGLSLAPLPPMTPMAPIARTTEPAAGAEQAAEERSQTPRDEAAQALEAPATRRLLGGLGEVELSLLRRLARLAVPELMARLPPNVGSDARESSLGGRLERMVFALDLPAMGLRPVDWRAKAALQGLEIEQDADWPGARGLQLEIDATPKRGFARVGMRDGQLDPRPHLPEPTAVERLDAQLGWDAEPAGGVRLKLPDARLMTPDLNALIAAELRLSSGSSPDVDLHLQLRDADASAAGRYLPVRVLDPPLVDWLKRAVRGGRVTQGDLLLRGKLSDFPFDDHQGRFVLDLEIRDGTLDYSAPPAAAAPRPRWPALEALNAEVRIVNRRLDIHARHGRFLDSELQQGTAFIPNLWQPERMFIHARGQGPLADGRRVLLETPLKTQLGRLAKAFQVEGELGIQLELGVPFRRGAELDYQGELRWRPGASARLDLGEGREPVALNDIQGRLGFSNQGVEAQDIQARLGGQPIKLDVKTQQADGENAVTRTLIEVRGQSSIKHLAETFPSPAWDLVRGDAGWQLAISLSNQDFSNPSAPVDLELSSNLQGVSLALPAPLGKSAQSEMPLRLSAQLTGQRLEHPEVRLGLLKARLDLDQAQGQPPRLRAAALALNAEPPAPPNARELNLSGRLASLELGPWLDWWQDHRSQFGQGREPLPVRASGIKIDHLVLGVLAFRDLSAAITPAPDGGTQVRFKARDNAGTIGLPLAGSSAPVRVELARWRLASPDTPRLADIPVTQRKPAPAATDPAKLGPLEIQVEALEWNQYLLGRFFVRLVPEEEGVSFQDIQLSGPLIDARGQGSWRADDAGEFRTAVKLQASSPNAGDLLRQLALYQGLEGSRAQIMADLEWSGDPGAFALDSARGLVLADFLAGRLLDVEPGVGRMLGILNMAAIQRRLRLDFSDVVDDGLSFDQMTGQFAVADGLAEIQRFELLSSTADIQMTGTTNLIKETLDQTVFVTPKVGSGVALASALVGGPLVGAAVLLADKVSGGAMDQLTRHQYQITGPWREPRIVSLGMTANDGLEQALSGSQPNTETGARPSGHGHAAANGGGRAPPGSRSEAAGQSTQDDKPENLFLENF